MTGQCALTKLASLQDRKVLTGLNIVEGDLQADPALFTCCGGSSSYEDRTVAMVYRCQLRTRLRAAYDVLRAYARAHDHLPDMNTWQVPADLYASFLAKLGKKTRGGSVARSDAYNDQDWWALAFVAAWRHGYSVAVFDFARSLEIDADMRAFMQSAKQPILLLTLGIRKLWDAQRSSQLDLVVSFAYQCRAMAWFVFDVNEMPSQGEAATAKVGFMSRKVAALKARSPLQFVEAACYSRLAEMCDVVALD